MFAFTCLARDILNGIITVHCSIIYVLPKVAPFSLSFAILVLPVRLHVVLRLSDCTLCQETQSECALQSHTIYLFYCIRLRIYKVNFNHVVGLHDLNPLKSKCLLQFSQINLVHVMHVCCFNFILTWISQLNRNFRISFTQRMFILILNVITNL